MKTKRAKREQLNHNTVLKLIVTSIIIISVCILCGLFIVSRYLDNTVRADCDAFSADTAEVCDEAMAALLPDLTDLSADTVTRESILSYLREHGSADNYIIFAEGGGGVVLGDDGIISGALAGYGLRYDSVSLFTLGERRYIFAPVALKYGDTTSVYRAAAISDYTVRTAEINAMVGNTVAAIVICGTIILAALWVYAWITGNPVRYGRYKYLLKVNSDGRVVQSNRAFRKSFPSVAAIPAPEKLDKENYNLVKLTGDDGEKLVAMRVSPRLKGSYSAYAGDISNADAFMIAAESNSDDFITQNSFLMAYRSFTQPGKRVLVGEIVMTNLDGIKTLFGKASAEEIQKLVLRKVREKFTYVFEIDFGTFSIVYPDGKKLDNLLEDMEENFRYVASPVRLQDNLFSVEMKAGFALCDDTMPDRSFAYAMKAAGAARQRATETGIADYIIYTESQKKLYTKYMMEYDIRKMLEEGAFEMEYQPQYSIKEGRITGFEALFRIKKTWSVNVDTFSFITYAERTGAMVQLGDFIFEEGMKFARQLKGKNVSVSLNVSPVQLMQAGFVENFLKIYRKYNLKPGSVCVEITESFLMTNYTETLKKLQVLQDNGIYAHLDDFGTEYSSLLYLKKLPVSTIKIDKEFVKDILVSKESQAVVKFITSIGKLLNLRTICEGVETVKEYDMLNYLGCDAVQGWLISKSLKPEEALRIVDTFDYRAVVAANVAKSSD